MDHPHPVGSSLVEAHKDNCKHYPPGFGEIQEHGVATVLVLVADLSPAAALAALTDKSEFIHFQLILENCPHT